MLPPLKPIAMKERISLIFIERGEIDVVDGAFVVIDKNGVRTHIPVGSVACIMLEPGTRVSHRAAALAARVGTLLVWVGEAGVRLYASGQPGGARSGVGWVERNVTQHPSAARRSAKAGFRCSAQPTRLRFPAGCASLSRRTRPRRERG